MKKGERKPVRNKRENLKAWLRKASPYMKRCFHTEGMRLRLTENRLEREQ